MERGPGRLQVKKIKANSSVCILRYSDNALQRWSAICLALDFARCWIYSCFCNCQMLGQLLDRWPPSRGRSPGEYCLLYSHFTFTARWIAGQTCVVARNPPGRPVSPGCGLDKIWSSQGSYHSSVTSGWRLEQRQPVWSTAD